MRSATVFVLCWLSVSLTLSAQVSTHDLAVRLMESIDARNQMEPLRAELLRAAKADLHSRMAAELGAPTDQEYEEVDRMVDQLVAKYTIQDTLKDFVEVLQTHFTAEELQGLDSFFRSPLGKKFIEQRSAVTREALERMNQKMQPAIQETARQIYGRIDEMKAKRQRH